MPADAQIPVLHMLVFERERLRSCREALQQSASPEVAHAWAVAVHDGERRVHQLAAACRELGGDPQAPIANDAELRAHARALVAQIAQALRAGAAAPPPRIAPSSTGSEPWELRLG